MKPMKASSSSSSSSSCRYPPMPAGTDVDDSFGDRRTGVVEMTKEVSAAEAAPSISSSWSARQEEQPWRRWKRRIRRRRRRRRDCDDDVAHIVVGGSSSSLSTGRSRLGTRVLTGGLLGSLGAMCMLAVLHAWDPDGGLRALSDAVGGPLLLSSLPGVMMTTTTSSSSDRRWCPSCIHRDNNIRRSGRAAGPPDGGILSYLELFRWPSSGETRRHPDGYPPQDRNQSHTDTTSTERRRLAAGQASSSSYSSSSTSDSSSLPPPPPPPPSSSSSHPTTNNDDYKDPQLVIAGKMAVQDAPCNIGQYNLKKKQWSLTECIQLSLYNSYSGGEVYSLLANHTTKKVRMDEDQQQQSSAYPVTSSSSTHPNT